MPTGRLDEDHFLLDIITTNGGLVTLVVSVSEARLMLQAFVKPGVWETVVGGEPEALEETAKRNLRVLLINMYSEYLSREPQLVGHDEEGGSWAIRSKEVVAIRVVDPEEAPEPPTRRQIGFGRAEGASASRTPPDDPGGSE